MLKNDRHTYHITWSEQDNEHLGLCAEFPSLSWLAPTPEAALQGIRQVVADVVADIAKVDETAYLLHTDARREHLLQAIERVNDDENLVKVELDTL